MGLEYMGQRNQANVGPPELSTPSIRVSRSEWLNSRTRAQNVPRDNGEQKIGRAEDTKIRTQIPPASSAVAAERNPFFVRN